MAKGKTTASNRFSAEQLLRFAEGVYTALGLSESQSRVLTDSLVQADLWGHQSHGIMRTFWYAKRIQSGATNISSKPKVVVDGGAIAVVEGGDGIGQVVARKAMSQAVARARQHGIGAVAVRNSGHFRTAMYFTRKAAQADCVAFLSTNASPAMAPWGGRDKLIGNNPWSIAAPAGRYPAMVLDISNTAVARGKLYLAKQRGDPIPVDWAINEEGRSTTNPAEGILGNILPMAGHKGYAIATLMDVLSGVLSGSEFADGVTGPYMTEGRSGAGHLAIALHISSFRPLSEFTADMEAMIGKIKRVGLRPETDEVFYPGELEARAEKRQREIGVDIPLDTVNELDSAAKALGVMSLTATKEQ
jgi:LDH2 family malate/lactate/ureidoglycolate dehydrogenase